MTAKKPYIPNTQLYMMGVLATMFVVTAWVASHTGTMSELEETIFRFFYEAADSLWVFALVMTQLGSGWVLMGLVGLLFVLKRRPEPALIVLRAGVLAYLLAEIAKRVVGRPRPSYILDDVVFREIVVHGWGFPSGHTALATAVGLSILPYIPKRWRWLPVVWIGVVAWSRLYLGVHTPLDVLGGLILGAFVALAASYIPWWGVDNRPKR